MLNHASEEQPPEAFLQCLSLTAKIQSTALRPVIIICPQTPRCFMYVKSPGLSLYTEPRRKLNTTMSIEGFMSRITSESPADSSVLCTEN